MLLLCLVTLPGTTPGGRWILLSVTDTGPGIDPATLERMFDPFFTTKENGQGTGMGLAIVHGIMKSSGGRTVVDSSRGQGTRVKLSFPELAGLELAEAARQLRPDLPVILCSGEMPLTGAALREENIDYLSKPVAIEKLLERVAAHLDR